MNRLSSFRRHRCFFFACRKRLATLMKDTEKKLEIHREVIAKIQQQVAANK